MQKIILIISFIICCSVLSIAQINLQPTIESAINGNDKNIDKELLPKFVVKEKLLIVKNVNKGVQIDIYSVLGARVATFKYNGNDINLNLSKGIYIVRVEKFSQKIIL